MIRNLEFPAIARSIGALESLIMKKKECLFRLCAIGFALMGTAAWAEGVRLDQLDIRLTDQDWGQARANRSVDRHPLNIGGTGFEHGLGTHANSSLYITLNGATNFSASVGVDAEVSNSVASVEFIVLGDGRQLWHSGVMRANQPAKSFALDVHGVKTLALKVAASGEGVDFDHADWADARFEYEGAAPVAALGPREEAVILTPPAQFMTCRINGPDVVGARPGHPFFYHIPVTSEQPVTGRTPITIEADNLPAGLTLDAARGEITGVLAQAGEYNVALHARKLGSPRITRVLKIVAGDKIALTPPLGFNSWNCFAGAVDDAKIRAAADAMVSSGLINHGWTYINIDDCWEGKRDENGMIQPNKKFPDMKALADYVHSKGLKIGLYSSPGPKTCAGFEASWQHEVKDAQQYAAWGFDYLKYDWCSYSDVQDKSLPEHERLMKPYQVMQAALRGLNRDIVFSLCQYGMGNVWEWGAEVGGNCWRTTGDISDSWSSMSHIGFGAERARRNTPGRAIGMIPTCWWWEKSAGAACIPPA